MYSSTAHTRKQLLREKKKICTTGEEKKHTKSPSSPKKYFLLFLTRGARQQIEAQSQAEKNR